MRYNYLNNATQLAKNTKIKIKFKYMFTSLFRKRFVGLALIASLMFLFSGESALASSQTQLSQTINAGTLGVDIVNGSGVSVGGPTVSFASAPFSFSTQTSAGTLGVTDQKIRVSNGTTTATWSMTLAATSGNTALWSDGSHSMDFNGAASAGRLTVDPSGGTITPTDSYSSTGLTKGSSTAFAQSTVDSITLLSAGSSADKPGRWDFIGALLTQDIPAAQSAGTYTINMTLTVS